MQHLNHNHSRWHQGKAVKPVETEGILTPKTESMGYSLRIQQLERKSPDKPMFHVSPLHTYTMEYQACKSET